MCVFCKAAHLLKTFIGRLTLGIPAALRSVTPTMIYGPWTVIEADPVDPYPSVFMSVSVQYSKIRASTYQSPESDNYATPASVHTCSTHQNALGR
jgi:hypothetical protein